jgi:cephalosporin-C deacetylase
VKTYLSRYPQQEERVLKTLSYFDPINIAHRIRCQSLFVLGLKDSTAPPQDSLGVYNRIEGEKGLKVFPYDGYGAGGDLGKEELVRWMQDRLMP